MKYYLLHSAVYRIFAKGGRTWSRGGARLFVAAGQPQGGGCRRGMWVQEGDVPPPAQNFYLSEFHLHEL